MGLMAQPRFNLHTLTTTSMADPHLLVPGVVAAALAKCMAQVSLECPTLPRLGGILLVRHFPMEHLDPGVILSSLPAQDVPAGPVAPRLLQDLRVLNADVWRKALALMANKLPARRSQRHQHLHPQRQSLLPKLLGSLQMHLSHLLTLNLHQRKSRLSRRI